MSFSPSVKEDALVACGRHCCLCHKFCGPNMEVHHIIQQADGGPDTFENAIPLCFDCHATVRAYDPRHPKGSKFTESELHRHRDNWYAKVTNVTVVITDQEIEDMDLKTYYKLKEFLPHEVMQFICDLDFAGSSFRFGQLDKVEYFPALIRDPLNEYMDADLEAIKVALANSILTFTKDSIPYLHSDDGKNVMIPRDWELRFPDRYYAGGELLNKDSSDIWEKYCDYIRLCRRKLRIEG